MTHPELDALTTEFMAVPHTGIPSNDPYNAGGKAALQDRETARRIFLEAGNEQDWPANEYHKLDTPPLVTSERQYLNQLSRVVLWEQANGETSDSALLYERVASKLAEVYRHLEVNRAGPTTVGRSELSRTRAANMSGELFGEPDESIFASLLSADLVVALRARASTGVARLYADDYLARLKMTPQQAEDWIAEHDPADALFELEDDTIEIIRDDLFAIFPKLQEFVASYSGRSESTHPTDARAAFLAALDAMDLTQKGWSASVATGRKAAETSGCKKEVSWGESRSDFTPVDIVGVPVHEAVHAKRYQNGTEQPESYRQRPLPGSSSADEGGATVIEQIITGVKRVPGVKYYLQLGLQRGFHVPSDSRTDQSFRAVHEIMALRAVLYEQGDISAEQFEDLRSGAYKSVTRTARGNARDNRDISYYNGACNATRWFNETARLPAGLRRQRLLWYLSGVFDPTSPEHVARYGGDPAATYLEARRTA